MVFVCSSVSGGALRRVDEVCHLNSREVVAAEDTIFALTPAGVYDVFSLSLAVKSDTRSIAGGVTHNLLLTADGDLYSWGLGKWGELGLGPKNTDMETPDLVRSQSKLVSIACGQSHSCAVDTFGNVFAWGQNFTRQLGLYTKAKSQMPLNTLIEDMVMTPRLVPFSLKNSVAKVACGSNFSFAVTKVIGLFGCFAFKVICNLGWGSLVMGSWRVRSVRRWKMQSERSSKRVYCSRQRESSVFH